MGSSALLLVVGLAPASSSLLRRWWAGGNATAHRLFTPSPRAEENFLASYVTDDPRAVAWCERKYRELPGVVTGCGFQAIKRDWLHKHDCGHVVRHLPWRLRMAVTWRLHTAVTWRFRPRGGRPR